MLLVAAALLAGCAATDNGAMQQANGGPVAFRVGDCAALCTEVTVAEVQQRMQDVFGAGITQLLDQGQTPEQVTQLADQQNVRQNLMDRMIQEMLLGLEARKQGVGIDPQAVDDAVAQEIQNQQSQVAPGQTAPALDPAGKLRLRENTARFLLALEVGARQIRADQFKARHIQVQTEQEARQILNQLNGGVDFAQLAERYSQDPLSAPKGGELGWLPAGSFIPEVEQFALDESKPLNVPEIIQSTAGYHVVLVEARQKNRPFDSFEQLRQSPTAGELYQQWYEGYRQQAEQRGEIEIVTQPSAIPLPFPQN
jgi:peptidyl-prolyl cis-trans isomerase C